MLEDDIKLQNECIVSSGWKRAGRLGHWWGAVCWVCAVFVMGFIEGWTGETKMLQGLIASDTEGVGDFCLDRGIISWMVGAEKNR